MNKKLFAMLILAAGTAWASVPESRMGALNSVIHNGSRMAFLPLEVLKTHNIEVKTKIIVKRIEFFDTKVLLSDLALELTFMDSKTGKELRRETHVLLIPNRDKERVADTICKKFDLGPATGTTGEEILNSSSRQTIYYILDADGNVSPETGESFFNKFGMWLYVLKANICSKPKK